MLWCPMIVMVMIESDQAKKVQLTFSLIATPQQVSTSECKIGLGYNDVPPPYTGNFMPPKPDLSFSGLEEFTSEPIVIKPVAENSEAKASEAKPKAVRKNNGALIIEDWVFDNEEDDVSQAKIEKKTFKPSFAKIEFVKPKQKEKTARKTVNHVEQNRQNIHTPRGNQRNWNNMMSQRLGSNIEIFNKACYVCRSFDHLQRVNTVKDKNVNTVRPKAVVNAAKLKTVVNAARPKAVVNAVKGNNVNDVKASACVARTPQQNRVAERKNRTLIEAAGTMLADSKLPTAFWAEAVNTACYAQNRVLVTKPSNKTPYELFLGRKPALGFMRPFGCPVTILNTIDYLGKFNGKADEGFFVRYLINSKAFRVFNNRTRVVEENLHVQFSENTPNIIGSGPNWLFNIDALTKSMNYKPVVVGNQSNGNASTKACDDAVLKNDAGFKPLSDGEKKINEDPRKESKSNNQKKEDNVNSTNTINATSTNVVGAKTSIKLLNDPNMLELEDYNIFEDDEDVGAEADMNNLDAFMPVSPIPTTRVHKDHPEEPKKVIHALKDPSWIEAMQEELLQFKLQEVWTLVDLPNGKRPIGTKWVFRNKKDERGIVIKSKARLVTQGWMSRVLFFMRGKIDKSLFIRRDKVKQKEDGIFISQDKYVIEILKKFGFTDVKTANTPMETQKLLLKDKDGKEVDVHLYRSMIGSLMYLTYSRPDIMFAVCACVRYQVNPKVSHLHDVNRIFRYLKGQPKLGLWYPKDSPLDLVVYTNSDYAGASLDRKSITGGCQFLGCRLISWQCKKQTVVANSITEAEYVAASSCFKAARNKLNAVRHNLLLLSYYCWVIYYYQLKVNASRYNLLLLLNVNVVEAFLSKPSESEGFELIVDFLNANPIRYALMINPIIYTSCIEQFRATVKAKIVNGEIQLQALVDGKKIIITESIVRRDLQLEDAEDNVADKTVNKEMEDSLERAATTTTSLDAEQDRGGGPRRQETMRDTIAQTRSENVSKHSNDLLLARVKKLENKGGSRTHKLKRLYKVGRSTRMVSSDDASLGDQEDASKQGRKIDDIYKDAEITLINETQGRYGDDLMFDTGVLDDEEVFTRQDINEKEINVAEKEVSTADPVTTTGEVVTTASPTKTTTADDLTLAQTLIEIRSVKSKVKGVVIGEQSESTTRTRPQQLPSKDKGKAELEEEDKLVRQREKKANIVSWDNVQAMIDADYQMAQQISKRAGEELEQESSKKQKLEEDKESEELKQCLEIVPDNGDDVTIYAIPLSTKSPTIVEYKIHKEGKKSFFQIIRVDGKHQMYLTFGKMLKNFDREDLEVLWSIVKAIFKKTEPMFNDLKLQVDYECEMAFELLRLVKKQLKKAIYLNEVFGSILLVINEAFNEET
ncbi:putative ribonuclease H-like domain-containing protein [Tanacetum coccineum]